MLANAQSVLKASHTTRERSVKLLYTIDTIENQFTFSTYIRDCATATDLEKWRVPLVQIAQDVFKASKSARQKRIRLLYAEFVEERPHRYRILGPKEETLLL